MQGKKPLNIAIGRRIQQSREQAGLTQEELAERIDRSTQFISTIERGLAGPSLETVIHLCEVLGTSTEWILRGRALLPDSNLLAASVMEKLSGLSPAQLLLVDRMTSDLITVSYTHLDVYKRQPLTSARRRCCGSGKRLLCSPARTRCFRSMARTGICSACRGRLWTTIAGALP